MMTVYFAAPLFTRAEQDFNRSLVNELTSRRSDLDVVLPQDRAKTLLPLENGLELVFRDCLQMIDRCDVVVAVLDGPDADSGTCVELGYAYARRKPIMGLRTDSRASEDRGLNLMVSHVCDVLIRGSDESTLSLAKRLLQALDECMPPSAA